MKSIVLIALALAAVACAAPAEDTKPIEIVAYRSETQPDGSYSFFYRTSDGSERTEQGVVKEALDEENKPQKVVIISGSYTVLDSEGKPDTVNYYADETGYHAEGKSIPKAV
ncbi:hypothetical protein PYW07_015329 [Mythimna separata]|uniref:Uncharacterized protein n=1 Tax=Mythimna separata TaxID=271217 RepID=A0AAD7YX45_MYTSE|nr:hypothetical protein PYW07_015329 [Mythimna separata]